MSELQIGLLVIGVAVVLAVYGYGAWQQRQYRHRFGAAFKAQESDVLYRTAGAEEGAQRRGAALPGEDAACATLDEAVDYIALLSLPNPMRANVLAPLWQQRFDFGTSVNICGQSSAGLGWERVVAEGLPSYVSFRLALQLADRGGSASEAQLGNFRDLVQGIARDIQAELVLPDVAQAAARARRLDEFCAEVDQMIGLNILPSGNRLLAGRDVARVAAQHGMELQVDGAFHLLDARGGTLFSLANFDSVPFRRQSLEQMELVGLSLQLDVPHVENPARSFDDMMQLAKTIGGELHAAVVDDYRAPLSDAAVSMIRAQIVAIENRLRSHSIPPGSAKAQRLFS